MDTVRVWPWNIHTCKLADTSRLFTITKIVLTEMWHEREETQRERDEQITSKPEQGFTNNTEEVAKVKTLEIV